MTNFGDLMSCFFERFIQKCTLYHVLILIMTSQIWQIMGSLKIQKLEYKKILNLGWHIWRSYRFCSGGKL